MSTATELLKEIYADLEYDSKLPLWLRDKVRTFLAAEEQYDALSERYVEGLGNSMKACKESFEREAERVKELLTAEPEVKLVAWQDLTDEELREIEKEFQAKRVRTSYWDWQRAIEAKLKEKNHPPRPEPASKPMTEDELENLFKECHGNFEKVVRAIEKHHGIGVNQSDPDSIDLQSRCRGDKE